MVQYRLDYCTTRDLNNCTVVYRLCGSVQGGLLDNPGLVTKAAGNVLDKWEKVNKSPITLARLVHIIS